MIPVTKLKWNLEFNKNLGELIEVMKLAATLQFNQLRSHQEPPAEFLSELEAELNTISYLALDHYFLKGRPGLPSTIILITSDEGFLGELNVLLVNRLMEIRQNQDRIMVLGQQGVDFLEELKVDFEKLESDQTIQKLRDDILSPCLKGEIDKIQIVYARFVNIVLQQIESETLIPLPRFSTARPTLHQEFLIEPDIDLVMQAWVKLWLEFRLYQILWSSKLAESASRIMHLEGSIQELNRVSQHLRLEYFKHLHNLSDRTIREVSATRLLLMSAKVIERGLPTEKDE